MFAVRGEPSCAVRAVGDDDLVDRGEDGLGTAERLGLDLVGQQQIDAAHPVEEGVGADGGSLSAMLCAENPPNITL